MNNIKDIIKMNQLTKKLSSKPENIHGEETYTAWVNDSLFQNKKAENEGNNIENKNYWFGQDFTKKAPNNTSILLLFPDVDKFGMNVNMRLNTYQTLEDLTYDDKNWKSIKISKDNFKFDKTRHISALPNYFNYLLKNHKILPSMQTSENPQSTSSRRPLPTPPKKSRPTAPNKPLPTTQSRTQSAAPPKPLPTPNKPLPIPNKPLPTPPSNSVTDAPKKKKTLGKRIKEFIHNPIKSFKKVSQKIKDRKLDFLAKTLAFESSLFKEKVGSYFYYNSKLFGGTMGNGNWNEMLSKSALPYWYESKVGKYRLTLLFPAFNGNFFSRNMQRENIKIIEKNTLNVKNWEKTEIPEGVSKKLSQNENTMLSAYLKKAEKEFEPLHESYDKLIALINEHKTELSEFHNKYKDGNLPGFPDAFSDLKKYLNGNQRGAEKLEFNNFLKKYAKKLQKGCLPGENTVSTSDVIEAINKAIDYINKMMPTLGFDAEKLNVKAKKMAEFFDFQSKYKSNVLDKLNAICNNYRDECSKYLSADAKDDFVKKFDYLDLQSTFPDDFINTIAHTDDRLRKKLISDYKANDSNARLQLYDMHKGQTSNVFQKNDIGPLEKCKAKTQTFFNTMHEEAAKLVAGKKPIPAPPIEEANKLFDNAIKKVEEMRDNWNK